MAHSTNTTNYKLSQFTGTDKPAWLEDYNADMLAIDTNLKSVSDTASATSKAIPSIQADLDNVEVTANSAESKSSAALSNQADVYDAASTYSIGDMVLYNHLLYKCIKNISTAESFDGTKWKRISIEEVANDLITELNRIKSGLSDVSSANISAELKGVTVYGSNHVYKNMKVVHLYATMDIPAIDYNDAWIASIPSEFRPSGDRYIVGVAQDGTPKGFNISSSGHIRNTEPIPNKIYYFDSTWIL